MEKDLEKQIELLKQYNISDYSIENDKIIINGDLWLGYLKSVDKDFLKDTVINGSLDLRGLKSVDKDFLKDTVINGSLDLRGLKSAHKDFLKGTIINGHLDLDGLTRVHKDFLKGTIINHYLTLDGLTRVHKDFLKDTFINGSLHLSGLTKVHKDFLKDTIINGNLILENLKTFGRDFLKDTIINGSLELYTLNSEDSEILASNVKQLEIGYNKEKGYCFFDGILSKVLNVTTKGEYTVYTTPFEIIVQKGDYTAHAKTFKQGVLDVEFKIVRERVKQEPIEKDTLFTVERYRMITGACSNGCRNFMVKYNIPFKEINNIPVELEPIRADILLPMLIKDNSYGIEKIRELANWL